MKNASLIRVGLLVGTLVGGAFIGRKAIDKQIERKMSAATEEAIRLAEEELDRSVKSVLRERIVKFLRVMAVKVLLLGIAALFFALEWLTLSGLRATVLILGLSYIVYDLRGALPQLLPALAYARRHKFKPKSMVTDAVAAASFERAYEEAVERIDGEKGRHWITLSSFNTHELSTEIAGAVSEVARHASYDKVRPRALMFAGFTATLSLAYFGLAWLVVHL
ncbi:hypothetical protein HK107_02020 [Parvularcula sp. ZS-1/3]|uniref:Uncharacterized protein n=1 Tax=Parvularcula mediterranea TaxID=2732508 RepID=A0A7Y3RJC3_9PROT|nr:hypothetical protein [Parvularcula mediterranea]NNU15100.1 hypothetical protein [Parvularcula mediterranea]